MKKIAVFILTICVCLGLCACGNKQNTKPQDDVKNETTPTIEVATEVAPEKVSAEELFDPDVNVAAAQQFIGKETTVFGSIAQIAVDYCLMDVAYASGKTVTVSMETSVLANFKIGDIQAITGIVSAVRENGYDIKDGKVEDKQTADIFIQNSINTVFQDPSAEMLNNCNMQIICNYVSAHGKNLYKFESQAAAENYFYDTWKVYQCFSGGYYLIGGYKLSNGRVYYNPTSSLLPGDFEIDYHDTWELSLSHISSSFSTSSQAYKMSEDYCLVKAVNLSTFKSEWYLLVRM